MNKLMFVFSPIVNALFLSILGIVFTFFPPNLYAMLLKEESYMFLDFTMWIFIILCILGFSIGCLFVHFVLNRLKIDYKYPVVIGSVTVRNLLLLVTGIVWFRLLYTISKLGMETVIGVLIGSHTLSITAYREIYDKSQALSSISWIPSFSFVTLNLALWLNLTNKTRKSHALLMFLSYFAILLQAIISQTRGSLFVSMGSIFLLYFTNKLSTDKIGVLKTMIGIISVITLLTLVFVAIDVRRGGLLSSSDGFASTFAGYFISEFNRLSRILDGGLTIPYSGQQSYAFYNILYPPLSNKISILNLGSKLGFEAVDYGKSWSLSFHAVKNAFLNENFNWYTIFGSIFSDLRWLSPIWFFFYGAISHFFWMHFRKGALLGILVYPWIWLTILTWWGAFNVLISSSDTILILFFSMALNILLRVTYKGGFR